MLDISISRNWVSVEDRLPTVKDIEDNCGNSAFWVTAIYGIDGKKQEITMLSNYSTVSETWDVEDEIVTHWCPNTFPAPAHTTILNCDTTKVQLL